MECCNDQYIPLYTYNKLKSDLSNKLYGQHIARDIIYSAVHSHVHLDHPRKPLVLSLHGLPGSGKNYIATMIANALFKKGEKSKFFHFFNGRNDFPRDKHVEEYKITLHFKIEQALSQCERSLFIFDEVDKMPAGILDVLVPFIDYTSWKDRYKAKAIFIFLSNTGSEQIVQKMISLWKSGVSREETTIRDFEPLITIGAFNEEGGLHKSGTIESKLIDHHIPFLPMEEKHLIECIKDVFSHFGVLKPSNKMISDVLLHVSFGPEPYNLYSTAGCKRLDHKVSSIVYKDEFQENF
ncbi:torsin-like protein [Copidosoma floridanum]|uniref:torsin-like protein n=1 Tax=Copidosoma floridanum TaxID=29053 RepID=UPI0006C95E24|nr:torsin-like protein [Copidosoma floridanum]